MKRRIFQLLVMWIFLLFLFLCPDRICATDGVEKPYHGRPAIGSGFGMLENWCAAANFDVENEGGIDRWSTKSLDTCHTGLRPGRALLSRQWNGLTATKGLVTPKRDPNWLPIEKLYDDTAPLASGGYRLPLSGFTERKGLPGAKVYPFNPVAVSRFVVDRHADLDDVIPVAPVKVADRNRDDLVTSKAMNFSISHSVKPAAATCKCDDCHGKTGRMIDWKSLDYTKDPVSHPGE